MAPRWRAAAALAALLARASHAELPAGEAVAVAGEAPAQRSPPPPHLFAKHKVPPHAKFVWTDPDGVLELEANRSLRAAAMGRGERAKLVLKPGKALLHERFAFKPDRAIHLEANPALCLGAEGGQPEPGARVVLQTCERDGDTVAPHQRFSLGLDSRIKAITVGSPFVCMNVKDNKLAPGVEIVLGGCGEMNAFVQDKLFEHRDGMIQVKRRTDLHFNVHSGAAEGPIVLWKSEASLEDSFELLASGQLRLRRRPAVCLFAAGGVSQGSAIAGGPCSEGHPLPNEMFGFDDSRNVMFAKEDPNLVFNVKGGLMLPGDQIVLWPAEEPRRRRKEL